MFRSARSALVGILALTAAPAAAETIETPDYEVVASRAVVDAPGETIEVRRYAPMIVAEVTVEAASREAASSEGFMPLAGYIFGRNAPGGTIAMTAPVATAPVEASGEGGTQGEGDVPTGDGERIAMTAPVATAPVQDGTSENATEGTAKDAGRYTVRFMMPSDYTMETLPAPLDPDVTLAEVPERTLVALRFVGGRTPERVADAEAAVSAYIEETGLEPAGPFIEAGYDGPDVPEAERRWEVQRPVASAAAAAE